MKRILLSMVACAAMTAQAQTVSVVKQFNPEAFGIFPASLTTGGKALFWFSFNDDNDNIELQIMDSSFNDVKSIKVPTKTLQSYRIVYDIVDGKNVNGVKEVYEEETYELFERISFYDVDNFDDEDLYTYPGQTLFNSDENFEFLRYEYETELTDSFSEGSTFIEYYEPVMKRISVVQDNGTVLATIHASTGKELVDVDVVKCHDEVFLIATECGDRYDYDDYNKIIYKWNYGTNNISKVKEFSGMRVYPNPARRNEMVTVDVPENVQNGSLIVTNSAGMTLQTVKLNGQRQAAVSTARMTSGIYNVTLVSDGKIMETSRIIVK